jgi:hypothetical protein
MAAKLYQQRCEQIRRQSLFTPYYVKCTKPQTAHCLLHVNESQFALISHENFMHLFDVSLEDFTEVLEEILTEL